MEELDLEELLVMFWEKKKEIVFITIICIIIGGIYTVFCTTPMYSSSTTLVLVSSGNSVNNQNTAITTTDITMNSKLVSTYSVLIKSDNVIRQVVSNLGININEAHLKKNISVSAVNDTEVIKITVANEEAKISAKVANEIVKVFTELVKETYKIENVQVVDVAEISEQPSNINHIRDIAIFAFIGIVIAVAYVLILNMLDTTIKTANDVEKECKLHVLAAIPYYNADDKNVKKGGRK